MADSASKLRVITILAAGCGALAPVPEAGWADTPMPPVQSPACTIRELSRRTLTLDSGTELYVQPSSAVPNRRGQVLLAGESNFAFAHRGGGRSMPVMQDSVFGAVVNAHGRGEVVRSPVPGRLLAAVRAAPRSDARWEVLFAEVRDYAGPSRGDTVARLWHGLLNGSRWDLLEQLPLPPGGWLSADAASSPVMFGDTLAWALPFDRGGLTQVALFLRSAAGWSYEIVPTTSVAYVQPGHSRRAGLILAVVQPDPALASDVNSLFLWSRSPAWQPVNKLVAGSDEEVHRPILVDDGGWDMLAWTALVRGVGVYRTEAHLRRGTLPERMGPVLELDPAASGSGRMVQLDLADAPPLWVTSHTAASGNREIRVVYSAGSSVEELLRFPDPYLTSFNAAPVSADEFVISGGVADSVRGTIATVLLRMRVLCKPEVG